MSQQPLLDCPVCLETKEKKDFLPLKCCGNFLCKQCERPVRVTHGVTLPGHQEHRFIRCPLCRQMESVSFEFVTALMTETLVSRVPRNPQEFSINTTPQFHLTPHQQAQRDAHELHQLVILQQRRQVQERQNREHRIQQERERIQRQEQEEHDRQYGANILNAMRLMDPRRLFRRQRQEVQVLENNAWIEEPTTPPGPPPGWIEPVPAARVPNNPTLRVPPPQVPVPTVNRAPTPPPIRENARRQARIAAPVNEHRRTRLCFANNCTHRTVFRCQTHTQIPCCRNCVCPFC